jgi:cell division protein FtsQ
MGARVWHNPRLLNTAAGALVGIALFAFAVAGALLLARSALFPVRSIELSHPLERTTRQEIESALRGRIGGNFFALDPDEVRAALEQLPWVRRASVRRVWPDRLEVTLEERVALARWGEHALVDVHGERFAAKGSAPLPLFIAPEGAERELAARYARFSEALAPLGAKLERLVLTPRFAWQLTLDNGLHIMLGRDADGAEARLARFVAAYPAIVGRMARSNENADLRYVDLRYPNGFALRVPEPRS